ncbi:MAG: glycoside hydrolase family 127 protein [Clostridia bacterium]|nr:glycoside hydrolase family 127 protein [Clostridia bacterium]
MRYQLGEGFWSRRIRQVQDRMIPLQLSILKDEAPDTEPSHAIENFKIAAGLSKGEFHGMVFQDSDVGKWIEAAAYSLMIRPDPELEREVDDIVEIIGKAQQPDGYLNTWFTIKEPGKRWTNLQDCHELYSFGHLAEGAVAYHQATGKRAFLDIMCRMADHIDTVIGPEEGKLHGYPGHPEAELALWRLYHETGNPKYLKLSQYFIDQRGTEPNFFLEEWERRGRINHWSGRKDPVNLPYYQAHEPVREQKEAVGHAVRALYLYTGMACIAAETKDVSLAEACRRLWKSAVEEKMYVTGGLGATVKGEAFMGPFELPNDTDYAETCASVALCFFGRAMSRLEKDGRIGDAVEQALYNTVLAGVSLEADRFFYVNPLEVIQGVSGVQQGLEHDLPRRPKWYACACCPPNVARLLTSLAEYAVQETEEGFVVHQYLDGAVEGEKAKLTLQTQYPWEGLLDYTIEAKQDITLELRIPGWVNPAEATLVADGAEKPVQPEKGFVKLEIPAGVHRVVLSLPLKPRRIYADPRVRQTAGCVAFARGPVVYCLEGCDNPEPLWNLQADPDAEITVTDYDSACLKGVRKLLVQGYRRSDVPGALYGTQRPEREPQLLTAIPYYAWANREQRDMRVWIRE